MKIEVVTPAYKPVTPVENLLVLALAVEQAQGAEQRALARVKLAQEYLECGEWEQAQEQFSLARSDAPKHPAVLRNLGLWHIREGKWELGLRLYDNGRRQLPGFEKFNRPYPFQEWQGQDLSGRRVLVWAEQGIGDQVMQARVLRDLIGKGALVSAEVEPRLIPALRRAFPSVAFKTQTVPLVEEFIKGGFDFQVSMLSAWRWAENPGAYCETLIADEDMVREFQANWRMMDAGGPRRINIGLSWSSKAAASGAKRSLSPAHLKLWAHAARDRIRFHNLQYDDRDSAAIREQFGGDMLTDASVDPLRDLDRQCAQIRALDLVISIDNATVHLAGAMGVPAWMLLPKGSEFRWGRQAQSTGLYPSVRLFRAPSHNSWAEVVIDIAQQLGKMSENATL